jgi:hypothetical protein
VAGFFILLVVACGGGEAPTEAVPTAPPPSKVPPTEILPTEPPTPAPVEPTAPSIPQAPLSAAGPWVLFASDDGVWALNPDGSGVTSIWDIYGEGRNIEFMRWWAAPKGGRVALLEIEKRYELSNPLLKLITLPEGTIQTITALMPEDFDYSALDFDDQMTAEQVWAAVGIWNTMAWSSDGTMLAFNAAFEGPSADLYVYSTLDGSITRLTDGPSQSVDPVWSPDDAFILHGAAEKLNYGYSGAGYDMLHVWAARPDDSGVEKVFDHEFYGYESVLGWLDDTRYLADSGEIFCGNFDLREIDIFEGVVRSLHSGHYVYRAYAPGHAKTLLAIPTDLRDTFECTLEFDPGVYLLDNQSGQAVAIPDIPVDEIVNIVWNEHAALFFVVTEEVMYTVDPTGVVMTHQAPPKMWGDDPVVDPGGTMWALNASYEGTLAVGTRSGDYIELDVEKAHNPIWSPDSQWLLFFGEHERGPSLFAAPAPDFEPILVQIGFLTDRYSYRPVLVSK